MFGVTKFGVNHFTKYTHLRREVIPQHPILRDYTCFSPLGKELNLRYNEAGMARRVFFTVGARGAEAPEWLFRLLPFLLFFLSFIPRLVAIGRYITPDEPTWVYRSIQFRDALLAGDWAGTLVAGHPGVITTWLGALGASVHILISPEAKEAYEWLAKMAFLTPDNVAAFERLAVLLSSGRLAIALVNSLGVVTIYLLARRLWGMRVAVVGGLFIALDPFLLGLSGLLHVDGLSATFVTISLLSLLVSLHPDTRADSTYRALRWVGLAGVTAALAVLSKTPSLLVIPVSGLALIWGLVSDRANPSRNWLAAFFLRIGVWGLSFAVTVLLLFPAAWAAPTEVINTVGGSANRHLGEALRQTFFFGETAFVHGPIFYPVVLLWRLSPIVWLSLLALGFLLAARNRLRTIRQPDWLAIILLISWVIVYLGMIALAAKKFDRYILPAVPALLLLAAMAWVALATERPRAGQWLLALVVTAQGLFWLAHFGYPLAAYNPLVGGSQTALNVLPVGWGEAIGAAGAFLDETSPDPSLSRGIAPIAPALAPFFSGQTLVEGYDDPMTADYVVVTAGAKQLDPVGVSALEENLELRYAIRFAGIDQAWVYRNQSSIPPLAPESLTEPATFGDEIALVSFSQLIEDDRVDIYARWQRLAPMREEARYILRIVIQDDAGNLWASQETPLLNEIYFYPTDWPQPQTDVVRYQLELPPGTPPGEYQVMLSLIDEMTASRLPVRVGAGDFKGVAYEAGRFDLPLPETIVSASRMQIPMEEGTVWLDGRLQLLGRQDIAGEVLAGSQLPIHLFWHAPQGGLESDLQLSWLLRPSNGSTNIGADTTAVSRFDTGLWRLGESIQEIYQIALPPDLSPGRYQLLLSPLTQDGVPIGDALPLAELQINNIDRSYELPAGIPIEMDVRWEPLSLAGLEQAELSVVAGEPVEVTLYWTKLRAHGDVYSVFVHVVDEGGGIVAQSDHWPGGLPTNVLDEGQVSTDRFVIDIPANTAPGSYQMRVGLYSAESGLRLPVLYGATGSSTEYVTLPVELRVSSP